MVVSLVSAGLLVILFIGMMLLPLLGGLSFGQAAGRSRGKGFEEVLVENQHASHKIAIVDIAGIITSDAFDRSGHNLVDAIEDQLELAGEDERVRAVIVKIDSPGGEVLASDDICAAIRSFQQDYRKPVVASMGGLAASGGYYVAVPCQWIVAHELTITGSIGVIMRGYNYRGLLNKVGVQPQVFKSGKFKDMLSGDKPLEDILPEERQMVQDLVEEVYARFKETVRKGRAAAQSKNGKEGHPLVSEWQTYADGRIFSGKQALEYGFVDELGTFDTSVARALKLAGIPKANLIRYQRPFDLANLFRLFGRSEARTLKIDFGVDLPRIEAGRLYFLVPTVLQ